MLYINPVFESGPFHNKFDPEMDNDMGGVHVLVVVLVFPAASCRTTDNVYEFV
jgi:hypothetical protein